MLEPYLGTDWSIVDMLKVPGTNTFLKFAEHARKEAKPRGLSRSHAMKTGCVSSPLWEREDSHKDSAFVTRSLLVKLTASWPPLYAICVTQFPSFSGIYLVDMAGFA